MEEQQKLDRKLLDALERFSEAFQVIKTDMAREYGLTSLQARVLGQLHDPKGREWSSSGLAKEFGVTRPTMGEVINGLGEKELLERHRSSHDGRRYQLLLTAKGQDLASRIAAYTQLLEAPLSRMKKEEKQVLLHTIMGLIHSFIRQGMVTVQRMCYTCRFYRQERGAGYCELLELPMPEPRVNCKTHENAEKVPKNEPL